MEDSAEPDMETVGDRLEDLRDQLADIEDLSLQDRLELFEEIDRVLGDELDALEDEVG